jgi:hypothetical protein
LIVGIVKKSTAAIVSLRRAGVFEKKAHMAEASSRHLRPLSRKEAPGGETQFKPPGANRTLPRLGPIQGSDGEARILSE